MARTPTVTDAKIMGAAQKVLHRRGFNNFTLSEVASLVGLSRAAIILRFQSTEALKIRLLRQEILQFTAFLASGPQEPGAASLLELATRLGGYIGSRDSVVTFIIQFSANINDTELAALEVKRGRALRDAISRAMPATNIDHDAAVLAFSAHLAGTIMAWPWSSEANAEVYLHARTIEWLTMAGLHVSMPEIREILAQGKPALSQSQQTYITT